MQKTFHVRVNGLAASRDFRPGESGLIDKALDHAEQARPDAVISLVEMYGDKQLGEMVVYRPA